MFKFSQSHFYIYPRVCLCFICFLCPLEATAPSLQSRSHHSTHSTRFQVLKWTCWAKLRSSKCSRSFQNVLKWGGWRTGWPSRARLPWHSPIRDIHFVMRRQRRTRICLYFSHTFYTVESRFENWKNISNIKLICLDQITLNFKQ